MKKLLISIFLLLLLSVNAFAVDSALTNQSILGNGMSLYGKLSTGQEVQTIGISTLDKISIDSGAIGVVFGGTVSITGTTTFHGSTTYSSTANIGTTGNITASGNLTISGSLAYEGMKVVTVAASATTTINAVTTYLIIKNTETIGTTNVVLPVSPANGRIVIITSVSAATVATVTAGATTVRNAPTAFVAGTPIGFIYNLAETAWFRSR